MKQISRIASLLLVSFLSACAAGPPSVVEILDDKTAVTVTHSGTPLFLSPVGGPSVAGTTQEFVQLGVLEINSMGALDYFLWLGVWDFDLQSSTTVPQQPQDYATVFIEAGSESLQFDVHAWSHEAIGISQRVYKKIFDEVDAFYRISPDQIRQLSAASKVTLISGGSVPKSFVPWYNQEKGQADLLAFVQAVSR